MTPEGIHIEATHQLDVLICTQPLEQLEKKPHLWSNTLGLNET